MTTSQDKKQPGIFLLKILFPVAIVSSIIFYSVNLFAPLNHYDESIILLNSSNIFHGLSPYKDFWTLYIPGYYYFLAGIFKLFGISIFIGRIVDLCFRLIVSIEFFFILKYFIGEIAALLSFLVTVLWLGSIGFYLHPIIPAIMLLLLAYFCVLKLFEENIKNNNKQSFFWLLLCGILSGFVFIIRWDFGLYTVISLGVGIVIDFFFSFPLKVTQKSIFRCLVLLFIMFFSMCIIAIPFIIFVGGNSGFQMFWDEAFISPIVINHSFRYISPPSISTISFDPVNDIDWILFYFPVIVTIIQLGQIIYYIKERIIRYQQNNLPTKVVRLLIISVLCLFSLLYSTSRFDFFHILPAQLFGFILFTSLISDFFGIIKGKIVLVLLLIYLAPTYILFPIVRYGYIVKYIPKNTICDSSIKRAECATIDDDTRKIVLYLQSVTKENEPIFVGNTHHDKILINDLAIYFLASRKGVNEYQELYPGVATTLPIQEKIVLNLKRYSVNYVVLVDFQDSKEANFSSKSSGVIYLDNFIRDNYLPAFRSGRYLIMKKKTIN